MGCFFLFFLLSVPWPFQRLFDVSSPLRSTQSQAIGRRAFSQSKTPRDAHIKLKSHKRLGHFHRRGRLGECENIRSR